MKRVPFSHTNESNNCWSHCRLYEFVVKYLVNYTHNSGWMAHMVSIASVVEEYAAVSVDKKIVIESYTILVDVEVGSL